MLQSKNLAPKQSEISLIKKIKKSLKLSKGLEHYEENINFIHMRSKSAPPKKDETKQDIFDLEKKFDKRFDKIDKNLVKIDKSLVKIDKRLVKINDNLKEIKVSLNSIFLLYALQENIPEEKDKYNIRNYIKNQYKKILPIVFKDPSINKNTEDENKNIPNQKKKKIKKINNINKPNKIGSNKNKKNPFIVTY